MRRIARLAEAPKLDRLSRQGGQATVEFAFILTVFLLLVMGVVDLGRAFWAYNVVASVAREGARYGTIPGRTETQIVAYAQSKAGGANIAVAVVDIGTASDPNDPVIVQASSTFTPITPLISQLCCSGGPLTMSSRSSMLVEK